MNESQPKVRKDGIYINTIPNKTQNIFACIEDITLKCDKSECVNKASSAAHPIPQSKNGGVILVEIPVPTATYSERVRLKESMTKINEC